MAHLTKGFPSMNRYLHRSFGGHVSEIRCWYKDDGRDPIFACRLSMLDQCKIRFHSMKAVSCMKCKLSTRPQTLREDGRTTSKGATSATANAKLRATARRDTVVWSAERGIENGRNSVATAGSPGLISWAGQLASSRGKAGSCENGAPANKAVRAIS